MKRAKNLEALDLRRGWKSFLKKVIELVIKDVYGIGLESFLDRINSMNKELENAYFN